MKSAKKYVMIALHPARRVLAPAKNVAINVRIMINTAREHAKDAKCYVMTALELAQVAVIMNVLLKNMSNKKWLF